MLPALSLEGKFQTQLQDPRLIRGCNLSEAAARARPAVRTLVGAESIDPTPLGMIESVERLQPELQVVAFRVELEISYQRNVPIVAARTTERIPV